MQNLNKNFSEFSSPCVDNSVKNQEKSGKNPSLDGGFAEKSSKTSNSTHVIGDFAQNSVENQQNIGVDSKNSEINPLFKENQPNTNKSEAQSSQGQENINSKGDNQQISDKIGKNHQDNNKNGENQAILTFEEQIERDFKDFEAIYPNVSKSSLLSDENLRLFAEGKESKQISVIYAKYRKLAESITEQAILQEKARKANADSASGALSSSQGAKNAYFTREQVKAMSPSEIKRNYELIRQSQQNW